MTDGRKKILFIITKSNWGGAQRYVYDLATHLDPTQFDVAVALGGTGGAGAGTGMLATRLGDAHIRTLVVHSFMRDLSPLRDLSALFELVRLCRREQPDVVHLNSSKAGLVGSIAARLTGVPHIVFTAHGWPFAERRNVLWRAVAWLGSWITALMSHAVVVITEGERVTGTRLPFCARTMHLIHNGVDLSPTLASGERIRSAFPPGARITGTIGELTKNKNQIALVEAARKNPDLYVALVGEGEDRPLLEKKIADYGLNERVKLFGFLPASEVLRGFDTFALPSRKEGLPYVLLEARAAGLPIVANRVGGVGEILDAPDMREFSLERMLEKTLAIYH